MKGLGFLILALLAGGACAASPQIRLIVPVETAADLEKALAEGIKTVRAGSAVVIDVIVSTGYSPAMMAGLTRSQD